MKIFVSDLSNESLIRDIAKKCGCRVSLVGGDLQISGSVKAVLKFKLLYRGD